MTGSLVRSLYRLYVRQVRSIARENLTVRAVRPLGAWLWEEFGEEPKPTEAGSRYRASACQDAAPWLQETSILGDGLTSQQVLQIVRRQFRSPSTADPSEQLDQAVQGLRALSDWTHLSRTSSLARTHGVEVELTGACLGLARDIAGGALRMALNFAEQAAATGFESDSQFEEEEFDEGMGDGEEAGWEGEENAASVSEAEEPGDGEGAEVSITGGALGHPEVLRMLHELMQASEAPRLGENPLESSSSSRAAHVPFSPTLKGKTEAMGASLRQHNEDLEADKEETMPGMDLADDGDDILCYLARLRISNTGYAAVGLADAPAARDRGGAPLMGREWVTNSADRYCRPPPPTASGASTSEAEGARVLHTSASAPLGALADAALAGGASGDHERPTDTLFLGGWATAV